MPIRPSSAPSIILLPDAAKFWHRVSRVDRMHLLGRTDADYRILRNRTDEDSQHRQRTAAIRLLIYGVSIALGNGGAEILAAYNPGGEGGMVMGITISVGGFISGAATCGDYNRYSKTEKRSAFLPLWRHPGRRGRTGMRRCPGHLLWKLRHHNHVC